MRFVLIIITFFLSSLSICSKGVFQNELLEIMHLAMAAICSVALFSYKDKPYSLYKTVHLFILFFFCIAPILQFKNNTQILGTIFKARDYIETSIYCLAILVFYNVFYLFFYKKSNVINKKQNIIFIYHRLSLKYETLFCLISFVLFVFYLYINQFSIPSLLFRGGVEGVERISISQIMFLLTNYFFRPLFMILFLVACICTVKHKIVLVLLGLFMLIGSAPTSMARFAASAIYIPVFMYIFPIMHKKNVFVLAFVLGIFIVFPLLDSFRHFTGDINIDHSQFENMNFDAYSMFMRILKDNIITNGSQLLGTLLFFVPRSIWPTKAIGSGAFVAEETDLSFSNISMPFFGEGYINFGNIGVFVFVIILAYATAKTDIYYWTNTQKQANDITSIKYYMLLGLLFFMLRGDLMSSFAYMCGFMLSFAFVKWLVMKNKVLISK